MKKHASAVRLFVALAALGVAVTSAACSNVNPASPSALVESLLPDATDVSDIELTLENDGFPCSDLAPAPRAEAGSSGHGAWAVCAMRAPDRFVR